MDIIERAKSLLGRTPARSPQGQAVRAALEEGRHAKFAGQYEKALERFGEAVTLAQGTRDNAAVAVVALHQAETLIFLRRYDEAEQLLASLQHTAQMTGQHVQLSYTLSVLGTLAQEQGDWTKARQLYEQALDTAKQARSAGAEGRALGHLADTYLHEGNASYAAHLLRECLPKLNTSGDIELSSYFVGLLGQAMIQSGQEVEGQHLLGRALQLAEHIHYRHYERHWSLVLGERALAEARYQDAYDHYNQAFKLFPPNATSPDYVAALCQMSQACLSLREYEQAASFARQALALSENKDANLYTLARGALGAALRETGRSAEAIPHLQAAVDANTGIDLPPQARRGHIEALRSLAAAQADAGMDDAAQTYERAVDAAKGIDQPLELAQVRRDLGIFYTRRGQHAQAVQEWQAALTIYEAEKHHALVARLYTDIGNTRKRLGQGARAMKDYDQALMALNSVDEGDLETRGLVYANAATAFVDHGDVESADSFFNDAISIAERTGDPAAESTRRGNYGWFLLTVGRPRRAIATLEQALRISKANSLTLQTAVQTGNLGLAHDTISEYETALNFHRESLDLIQTLDEPHWLAQFQVNAASSLLMLGRLDEAQTLLDDALTYARRVSDTDVLIRALSARAKLVLRRGTPDIAAPFLDEAQALARRADQRRLLAEVMSVQSEQRAALGRDDEAAAAWDEAHRLYTMLHMPQAKLQPAWLGDKTVKP